MKRSHHRYTPQGIKGAEEKLYHDRDNSDEEHSEHTAWDTLPNARSSDTESDKSIVGNKKRKKEQNMKKKKRTTEQKKKKSADKKPVEEKRSFINTILSATLVVSVLFFAFAVGVASYMFFSGEVFVSAENIVIDIEGNEEVSSGDVVELDINIENRNSVALQETRLVFRYPDGASDPDSAGSALGNESHDLGEFPARGTHSEETSFMLFGEEGEEKAFIVEIEYTIDGSDAFFSREKEFPITISDSPVSLSVFGPGTVNATEENEYTLRIRSLAEEVQDDIYINVEHPLNFSFTELPAEVSGRTWRMGSLQPGEERDLTFKGVFEDTAGEMGRTLSFSVGVGQDVAMHSAFTDITVNVEEVPFALLFDIPQNTVKPNDTAGGELSWINNSGREFDSGELRLFFSGGGVAAVSGDGAEEEDGELVWSTDDIDVSENGSVPFSATFAGPEAITERDVEVRAEFEAETTDGSLRNTEATGTFFVTAFMGPDGWSSHSNSVFSNRGRIPPEVGRSTDYTVSLVLTTDVGVIEDARMSATLPPAVSFEDERTNGENVSFNESARELTWDLGRVEKGAGVDEPERRIDIQVSFTPDDEHVGHPHDLLRSIIFRGDDEYTGDPLEYSLPNITTETPNDPQYEEGDGVVVF